MADNKQGKATTPAASEGKRATASVTSAATPKPTGELSDKDLDGVAGGLDFSSELPSKQIRRPAAKNPFLPPRNG